MYSLPVFLISESRYDGYIDLTLLCILFVFLWSAVSNFLRVDWIDEHEHNKQLKQTLFSSKVKLVLADAVKNFAILPSIALNQLNRQIGPVWILTKLLPFVLQFLGAEKTGGGGNLSKQLAQVTTQ